MFREMRVMTEDSDLRPRLSAFGDWLLIMKMDYFFICMGGVLFKPDLMCSISSHIQKLNSPSGHG